MVRIHWSKDEILWLLWDMTPVTMESTQEELALVRQQLSSLMLHYSRRREATALEQVKSKHEQHSKDF